ncbi:MAG: phosphohexomutase domain-containing protein [Saccharofermentanales bacterium]
MELSQKWKKLQNGSDIRGVALDMNPAEPVNLMPLTAEILAEAFVRWLAESTKKHSRDLLIAVGTDSRLSGPALKAAALSAISAICSRTYDCGIASTPAMFMCCVLPELQFDGGVMITASHLPSNRNGMKFFTKDGGLEKRDITAILNIAQIIEQERAASESEDSDDSRAADEASSGAGTILPLDLISLYAADIVAKIRKEADSAEDYDKPLRGLRIIVDAGNGAGGFFVGKVLEPLGADTSGSQFLDPDGNFPNHIPNPEDTEAMASIQRAVIAYKADFGIIFDTDVDRAGAVDKFGKEINRNRIIALMSAIVLDEHPGTAIVTDSITSAELKEFIENKLGGRHHRFKRGYKNVINESIRLNQEGEESHLAIETSGHGALKENYFLDDGAFLIAKILIKIAKLKAEGKTVDSLISELAEPLESDEFRFNILEPDFKPYGEQILADLSRYAASSPDWNVAPDNFEGIRVSFGKDSGNGWFLLRMSLHDPLMPLNIESNDEGGVRVIARHLMGFLEQWDKLDTAPLERLVRSI